MKPSGWTVIFILLIAIAAIFINLSQHYKVNIHTSLPGINTLTLKKDVPAINSAPIFKTLHIDRDLSFKKGLDLQGGTTITLQADMKDVPESQRDDALNSAKTVIERRINFFGVSEPVVQTSKVNKDYRIIVDIPGVTDVNQAVQLVGKTAKLSFWEAGPDASNSAKISTASAAALPLGVLQLLGSNPKQTNLSGNDLKEATVSFDTSNGSPQVQLTFTSDGAKKFGEITKRNVGKILAIVLDDQVVEAPRVNQAIYGGSAVITGSFTTETAKTLQVQLNAGALPVSLHVLEQHAIGATLGESSLEKSLFAGILGFIVIVVFMTVLYGRLGIIASVALILYTLIVLSLFRLIPVTLTLAGIAGFILTIGMAVDANILIFERMKEEMRRGRSHELAIDLGFSRAWPSIRDSNISSLITSAILYYFGTTIVRGFAFTLAIGVIVSMFSAIVVTRTLLKLFYRKG
jgi:preprotein translocase subunit SecD